MWSILPILTLSLLWAGISLGNDHVGITTIPPTFQDPKATDTSLSSIELDITLAKANLASDSVVPITTIVVVTPKASDEEEDIPRSGDSTVTASGRSSTNLVSTSIGLSSTLTTDPDSTCVVGQPVVKDGYTIYFSPVNSGSSIIQTEAGDAESGAIRNAAFGFMSFISLGLGLDLNFSPPAVVIDAPAPAIVAPTETNLWDEFVAAHQMNMQQFEDGVGKMGLVAKKCQSSCRIHRGCLAFSIYFRNHPVKSVCELYDMLIPEDVMAEAQTGVMGFNILCE